MKNFSECVEDMLEYIAGSEITPLVKCLRGKENVSEFKLAEDLKFEVNYVRNLLYRLYDYNLVSFTRRKDKLKGWYIYYWTFNEDKVLDVMIKIEKEKLDRLRSRHDTENSGFFFCCKNKCVRLDFEHATDFEFRCPECGEIVDQEDNSHHVIKIGEQLKVSECKIEELENMLKEDIDKKIKLDKKREKEEKEKEKEEKENIKKEKDKVKKEEKAKLKASLKSGLKVKPLKTVKAIKNSKSSSNKSKKEVKLIKSAKKIDVKKALINLKKKPKKTVQLKKDKANKPAIKKKILKPAKGTSKKKIIPKSTSKKKVSKVQSKPKKKSVLKKK